MEWTQVILLAILQGFTEFLPISSSAHHILVPKFLGWEDQGILFDVSLHLGTLTAVLIFFRKDLFEIFGNFFSSIFGSAKMEKGKIVIIVALSTIPVALIGIIFKDMIELYLRNPLIIAFTSVLFAIFLFLADRQVEVFKGNRKLGLREGIYIGIAQALALIPGTSRSGVTITAGLMIGMSRIEAVRFSFLLSIPIIFLGGGSAMYELSQTANLIFEFDKVIFGVVISAISAYICIYYFIKTIESFGMLPFVIYRILLGGLIVLTFN